MSHIIEHMLIFYCEGATAGSSSQSQRHSGRKLLQMDWNHLFSGKCRSVSSHGLKKITGDNCAIYSFAEEDMLFVLAEFTALNQEKPSDR